MLQGVIFAMNATLIVLGKTKTVSMKANSTKTSTSAPMVSYFSVVLTLYSTTRIPIVLSSICHRITFRDRLRGG